MKVFSRLTIILVTAIFSGCDSGEPTAEQIQLQTEMEDLQRELKEVTDESRALKTKFYENERIAQRVELDHAEEARLKKDSLPIEDYMAKLEQSHAMVSKDLENWRKATRESFIGYKIRTLSTLSGASYSNITVKSIGEDAVTIALEDGSEVDVPFEQMTLPARAAFVHEPTVISQNSNP